MTPARLAGAAALAVAAAVLPEVAGPFWMGLVTQMLVFGVLALSVDLLLGHAGLFSICHGSFFAVAAYTTALLEVRYAVATAVAAPAGLLAGTLLGLVFGLAVRTRGVYFILITIAFGYVVWGVAHRWSSFTGGDNGVTNVPFPAVAGVRIDSHTEYYYLVLVAVALVALGYGRVIRSPFGLALRGIKGSESRMRTLGYDSNLHLYAAFVLSAALASLAGVLYVYYNRFVNPVAASFPVSVEAALMAIIGGTGTILGPFIGSIIILGLRNWVSSFFELYAAIMGLVFIVAVLWVPEGLVGLAARVRGRMTAAVEVTGLVKEFGGLRAVDGVSLSVPPGERRVLIGPNGAGKTTLFHCVTGTLAPTAGRVALFGGDVTRLPEHRRTALGMGRTFQISNVIADLTCRENLLLAAAGTDARKWVLHRRITAFEDLARTAQDNLARIGLEHRADEAVRRLSYGERRQLELALALTSRPRVLFLDEPCAGLSPSERARISRMIAGLPRDLTVLMIEHDMDVALGLADRVTVLHRGRVILEGSPGEVQTHPEVREVYFGHV